MFNVKYIRGITSNFERYTQAVFYIQQIKYLFLNNYIYKCEIILLINILIGKQ